jgi:hypothetical protein
MMCFLCYDDMVALNDGVFYCPGCQYYEDLNLIED